MAQALARAIAVVATLVAMLTPATAANGTTPTVQDMQPTAAIPISETFRLGDAAMTDVRLAGPDRYETDAAVLAQYAPGVPAVYVTTGTNFPDALAAAAAAGTNDPIALADGTTVVPAVAAQIQRLQPAQIIVVGGSSAVSDEVGQQLAPFASGGWIRIAGADRYQTAADISAAAFSPGVPVAFVATGQQFPDALTASALGARVGGPVLLTTANTVPAVTIAELQRLRPGEIDILGGAGAVSATVEAELGQYAPVVDRFTGTDRYETNYGANDRLGAITTAVLATGQQFPDALAGGALAAHLGGALILSSASSPTAEQSYLYGIHPEISSIITIGGPAALPDSIATAVMGIIQSHPGLPFGQPSISAPSTPTPPAQGTCTNPTSIWCAWLGADTITLSRASEGLPAYTLPPNWLQMTLSQQLLSLANDERQVRELPTVGGTTAPLNADAELALGPPIVDPTPSPSDNLFMWRGNWAGFQNLLSAWYFWVYNDGPGSGNVDCTTATDTGCWGHRLNSFEFSSLPNGDELGYGAARGPTGITTILGLYDANNPPQYLTTAS